MNPVLQNVTETPAENSKTRILQRFNTLELEMIIDYKSGQL